MNLQEGDVVRGFRNMIGMSREYLAEQLGVTADTIGTWERNRTEMRLTVVKEIMDVFEREQTGMGSHFWELIRLCRQH